MDHWCLGQIMDMNPRDTSIEGMNPVLNFVNRVWVVDKAYNHKPILIGHFKISWLGGSKYLNDQYLIECPQLVDLLTCLLRTRLVSLGHICVTPNTPLFHRVLISLGSSHESQMFGCDIRNNKLLDYFMQNAPKGKGKLSLSNKSSPFASYLIFLQL